MASTREESARASTGARMLPTKDEVPAPVRITLRSLLERSGARNAWLEPS
jgi:hypothetical protein